MDDDPTRFFRKEAIPLVEVDEESKFSVNEGARQILEGLRGKVCVVSIAGLYRTGKSSLVNFLLGNDSKGFTVGPTVRRCTRGIWFWGEPKAATLPSGEPCWVIVLDTEGLGGLEADAHYDTRIFSLATLLCSTLVYNSLGSIDESAISNLSFVANLSQHIRVSDHDGDSELDAHEYHKFFPSFIWVVRDFALDLVDEYGTEITSDEYLERALSTQVGFDAATTERNRVRQMMTAFFTERKCYPLVRPVLDEATLQEIDKVGFDGLRTEFVEGVNSLKEYLYETNLKPKEICGRPLNGSSFVGLVEQYITAIEGGSVPTISTAWEEVMVKECNDAMAAGISAYEYSLGEATAAGVLTTEKLYKAHAAAIKLAISTFRSRAGGENMGAYQEEMEEELAVRFSKASSANEAASKSSCEEQISKLHAQMIAPKLSTTAKPTNGFEEEADVQNAMMYSDVASFKFDVQTLAAKYATVAGGPAKDAVLAEYALVTSLDSAQWLFERVDDAHEAKLIDLETQLAEAAGERAKVAAREKVVTDALEQQQRELIALSTSKMQIEAQVKATEQRMTSLLTELQRANRKKEELEQDLEDTKDALESEQTWQAQLHSRLEDMETKSTHKESKLDELGTLLETHKKEVDEKGAVIELQRERETELAKSVSEWESKHSAITHAHDAAVKEREQVDLEREEAKCEHEKVCTERAKLVDKRDALQQELASAKDKIDSLESRIASAVSLHGASALELEKSLEVKQDELKASCEKNDATCEELAAVTATCAERASQLEQLERLNEGCKVELAGAHATHAELLKAHATLANEHRAFQQKMNQRITYLKSQLDEHHSTTSSTSSELQRKAAREVELEKRLEVEINQRAGMQSEKDSQVFDLQKKLAEATTRLRQTESRAATLKTSLESSSTELNQIAAQRAVLLDEKEKMQALWEKSLTDHFNSLHETQQDLADTKAKTKQDTGSSSSKMKEMELKLEEYRRIVERVQTRKEGLLRKRTRSRLVKQTWHVKQFRLVGHSVLHRDTDNAQTGEKTFQLDAQSTVEAITDANAGGGRVMRNSFKVLNNAKDELLVAAIDRVDMNEWIKNIQEAIHELDAVEQSKQETKKRFESENQEEA